LDISDAFKINSFEQLFIDLILLEEKQRVLVFDIDLIEVSFFGGRRVDVNEDEVLRGQDEGAFGLVKRLELNAICLNYFSLAFFRALDGVLDVLYVESSILFNNARIDIAFEEPKLTVLAVVFSCNEFLYVWIDMFEKLSLQVLVLDELEPVVWPLFKECFDTKTTKALVRSL
jgi:hypothetical protein